VLPGIERKAASLILPPGGVLLLYTDGLVERRDQPIDEGLERLRTAVPDEAPGVICRSVTKRLLADFPTADDIAMLAIKRSL
jgi:serine phosphatase RsbU (regulator of sigma subunit)